MPVALHSLSITLPADMAELLKSKVASGEYATESEVIREGLRALEEREAAIEAWLRTEVVATYDAHVKDPDSALSPEDVLAGLELRAAALKAARREP